MAYCAGMFAREELDENIVVSCRDNSLEGAEESLIADVDVASKIDLPSI